MITFEGVSFSYGNNESKSTIHNINLKIKDGEIVVLCGESGCGKTTITRMINGLIPHFYEGNYSGNININGNNTFNTELYDISKHVGSVFQNPRTQFFNVDTNSELAFGCENQGMEEEKIKRRVNHIVKEFKIEKLMNRSIFQLSGGEKQKIACASVAITKPDIYVLDEPSSNLDRDGIKQLGQIIKKWKNDKKTVVIAEHRLYYTKGIADRYIYMKNGKIIKEYLPEEIESLDDDTLTNMGLRPLNPSEIPEKNIFTIINKDEFLCINNLKYRYKGTKKDAINISNLCIKDKSIVAVVGHNGAGKSTFASCLCGLKRKCRADILLNKEDKTTINCSKNRQRLSECYMVMQDVNHQLFTESVLDEVLLSMEEPCELEAMNILRALDLENVSNRHPMSLSGGQKQRVAIASAIASNRRVIVFDEPTSGLDMKHMLQVVSLMKQLSNMGRVILVITHDEEFIIRCCTHILHLEKGKVR